VSTYICRGFIPTTAFLVSVINDSAKRVISSAKEKKQKERASDLNDPEHQKSRRFLLAQAHPGGPGKRAVKWLPVCSISEHNPIRQTVPCTVFTTILVKPNFRRSYFACL